MISLTERARKSYKKLPKIYQKNIVLFGILSLWALAEADRARGWSSPVQSQPEEAVEVEGLLFTIEQNLERLVPLYGNLVVDFRNSFFGDNFSVNFDRQGSC